MREDNAGPHGGGARDDRLITIMGTNPFRRSTRTQGMVAGGWGEKKVTGVSGSGGRSVSQDLGITSRVFPLARSGSGMVSFRNTTSEAVYELAQHIQTSLVRSTSQRDLLQASVAGGEDVAGDGDLLGGTFPPLSSNDSSTDLLLFWGAAKDICDAVLDALVQERKASPLVDPFEETANLSAGQGLAVLTGLVRDMVAWIEQEDWERRLVKSRPFRVLS